MTAAGQCWQGFVVGGKMLERLERAGLVELPALRRTENHSGPRAEVALSERTASERPLALPLRELEPVHLEVVSEASQVGLWNEYVERFHPLGYKGAFGYRLRYFIRSGRQTLGCVLLGGAAKAIAVRDRWIGWSGGARTNSTRPRGSPSGASVAVTAPRARKASCKPEGTPPCARHPVVLTADMKECVVYDEVLAVRSAHCQCERLPLTVGYQGE